MLGLGLGLNIRPVGSLNPSSSFIFNGPALPAGAALTRASANGTRINSTGSLEVMAANMARFTYNASTLALRGLLVEPERTNLFLNNSTFPGFVAGSPGTNPTLIAVAMASATRTMVDTGTESGIPYFGYSWAGTPAGNGFTTVPGAATVAGVSGQTFAYSEFTKRQSGDNTNLTDYQIRVRGVNGSNVEQENSSLVIAPTSAGLATQWAQIQRTMNNAGTADVQGQIRIAWDGSGAVGFGIRSGGQQLELIPSGQSGASSTILTTGTAATRAADVLTLTVVPGVYNILIVRESGTTALTGVYCPGSFVVPTSTSPLRSVTFTYASPPPAEDYYVYSVSGSDSNYGTSLSQAWANLTKLPTLSAGDAIGLVDGSTWNQQAISSSANNIRITGVGSGAKPIIDGQQTATNCINLTGTGGYVSSVVCQGATDNNGSLVVFSEALIEDCESYDGTLHNLFFGWGAVRRCVVQDGDAAGAALNFSLIVAFTNVTGKDALVEDCTVGNAVYDADGAGIISHTDGVAIYSSLTVRNTEISNLGGGIAPDDCAYLLAEDVTVTECASAFSIKQDADIINPVVTSSGNSQLLSVGASNLTVTITGGRFCAGVSGTAIRSAQTGLDFTIGGGFQAAGNVGSFFSLMEIDHGTVTIGDMGFDGTNIGYIAILGRGTNVTLTTPGSYVFTTPTFLMELNGVTYNNLSEMQADGYFLNATIGTVSACA